MLDPDDSSLHLNTEVPKFGVLSTFSGYRKVQVQGIRVLDGLPKLWLVLGTLYISGRNRKGPEKDNKLTTWYVGA